MRQEEILLSAPEANVDDDVSFAESALVKTSPLAWSCFLLKS
jgi:hypothetical protein